MQETWSTRDLPVLTRIVERLDQAMGMDFPDVNDLASDLGMAKEDVGRAVLALGDDFIDLQLLASGGDPGPWFIKSVTPAARRVVGQWPAAERAVNQLVSELEKSAALEQDPDKKSKLRIAASTIGDLARDVATEVMAKAIVGSIGM